MTKGATTPTLEPPRMKHHEHYVENQQANAEIFWRYVAQGEPHECWLWNGYTRQDGYGRFTSKVFDGQRANLAAHRFSWVLHKGEVENRLHVLHRCDTPNCVNPNHLFVGTHKENMADCRKKNRHTRTPGEADGNSVLTEEQVREIRRLYKPHRLGAPTLATMFGIGESAIYAVVK